MSRSLTMSIAAVERDSGLSKDTLRVWEKRYGFPLPERDAQGERCYPVEQVEQLRLIKRLLDVGHRPGRVVGMGRADLVALAERSADAQSLFAPAGRRRTAGRQPAADPLPAAAEATLTTDTRGSASPGLWLPTCLQCVAQHDTTELRRHLALAMHSLGLSAFIDEVAAPLLQALGEGWLRGLYQVHQEHWASHALQHTLHAAIHALPLPQPEQSPRVLLSTLPGEPHGLGLLMTEARLSLLQAHPINLGPQTPLWDLVQASAHHRADVVALSFSASSPAPLVLDTLAELRQKLAPRVALWAGGRNALLQRRPPDGVLTLDGAASVASAVQDWRRRNTPR